MAIFTSLPARGATAAVEFSDSLPTDATFIVPVSQGEDGLEVPVTRFAVEGLLEALLAVGATGKAGETVRLLVDANVYLTTGLGTEITDESIRRAYGAAARALKDGDVAAASCEFGTAAVVEGLILGSYAYTGLKSTDDENDATPPTITVVGDAQQRDEFDRAVVIADSVNLARDLVNTPANFLNPASYAEVIANAAQPFGLEVTDLGPEELRSKGFGGILAVGSGSANGPHLVNVGWRPEGVDKRIALVGKGITFDTGGISLKPAAKMEEMISDMGGSAAQLGAVIAAARLNLPIEVDAWLPLAENMPSGTATRPGDVIAHYGGTTSEVINTDAEGRLVLADAIARACEDTGSGAPAYLIETATLTGAQLVALGTRTAGVMGTDEFRDRVAEIGRQVGEPAWAMPLLEEQEDELKSPVADIRNTHNARTGGMLFAGLYLSRFVPDATQWVHIDIAGPAWNGGKAYGYTPARATGAPVRTIVETLTQLADGQ